MCLIETVSMFVQLESVIAGLDQKSALTNTNHTLFLRMISFYSL